MSLNQYSRNKFYSTFAKWQVDNDFADPIYNYLIYGWSPGSCFTAVLANDFGAAIACSHPSNTITAFKALVGWMNDYMPTRAYGSYHSVKLWCELSDEDRRLILEQHNLIFTPQQETWVSIKGEAVYD